MTTVPVRERRGERARRNGWRIGALILLVAAIGVSGGCGKSARGGRSGRLDAPPGSSEPSGPIEPQRVLRDEITAEEGRKLHLRLIVDAAASDRQIEALMRRVAEEERRGDVTLWISVFLDSMDINSVAYAFGIAAPGQPLRIQLRESVQTYR